MPTIILLWIWCCAYLNRVGWTLSALHQLNAGGYAVALALGAIAFCFWRKQNSPQLFPKVALAKISAPFSKTISARVPGPGGTGVSGRGAASGEQLRCAGLSHATGVALAGGRTMALDPYGFSTAQHPDHRL